MSTPGSKSSRGKPLTSSSSPFAAISPSVLSSSTSDFSLPSFLAQYRDGSCLRSRTGAWLSASEHDLRDVDVNEGDNEVVVAHCR
eukprot:9439726-Prorocentrum_lima.AAC.1